MRLELTGRHVDITPALRRLVEGKLSKLERLLNNSALSAQAVLTREKNRRRADITLHARGEKFLHGVGAAANWEGSLTGAIDKITQQAQKVKGKWEDRKRQGGKALPPAAEEAEAPTPAPPASRRRAASASAPLRMPRVMRTVRQPLKAMSVADAARQLDSDNDGVVVFRDAETETITVLYRRGGELTLLETER